MGKPTGFMDYDRCEAASVAPSERIRNFDEFHVFLSKENQRKQAARCMDCGVPFCQAGMEISGMVSGCPLHNLVPEWNDLVYTGNWEQAYNRLHKTNNFPEFTSRVCPALCEKACTCGHWGDPVSVRDNEHGVIETAYENGYAGPKPPKARTGKKVAVIGSGPSGLAAADQLNQRGHEVTVYERDDRIGGLLMYGIPNMKLDKSVIDRKVDVMKAEGVKFVTGVNVGLDVKAADLYKEYDRVILCCGAKNPRDIKAPGRDAEGIYFAVDYLSRNTKSLLDSNLKDGKYISAKGKNVVIIGGGDTGNDCVGTAIRQGAKSVTQLEMMPCPPAVRAADNPWPEWPKVLKTDYGQEEAIAVFGNDPRIYQTTVKEFHKDKKGKLSGITIVSLEPKKDETTGRINMVEVAGSEKKIPAELVLIAAGFLGTEDYVAKAFALELDGRTNVATEKGKYATNVKNVYAAGDMRRGQSLVVWAIREGREVAREVDESLIGYSYLSIQ
ncbi:MAG: glutamate synthase subunit beta [Agathobacter sp.]|nr:glutamate synthase subunit beta [Agathobacter sp.]